MVQLLSVVCKRRTDEVVRNGWVDERTCLAKLDFTGLLLLMASILVYARQRVFSVVDLFGLYVDDWILLTV